jgi:hypothetical protein
MAMQTHTGSAASTGASKGVSTFTQAFQRCKEALILGEGRVAVQSHAATRAFLAASRSAIIHVWE